MCNFEEMCIFTKLKIDMLIVADLTLEILKWCNCELV